MGKYARLVSSAARGAITARRRRAGGSRLSDGSSERIASLSASPDPDRFRVETPMKRTGAQILWECLVREGVTTVFGYPGGAILPAYDAMLDYPIRHVLVRHEQGATHMADGYARASGKVGVAIATSGPGRDQHGHRHRHRDDGLVADRLHHRPGRQQADRQRRLPGNRHHRRHAADHQAQLPGHARARTRAGASARRSTSPRAGRPGPGAHRHHQGRAAGVVRVRLGRGGAAAARAAGPGAATPTALVSARWR